MTDDRHYVGIFRHINPALSEKILDAARYAVSQLRVFF